MSPFFKPLISATVLAAGLLFTAPSYAEDKAFANWIDGFKKDAQTQGVSGDLLNRAFIGMLVNDRVIELDRKQPEGSLSFDEYLERIVNQRRIDEGRRLLAENRPLLDKISKQYGVQPNYIVALWGIETNFGENTGGFSVIEALATLAYEGRRADFFREELIKALKIIDQGHISLEDMKGSWAGAMGQSQFMPSSFLAYAQDYNGDGHKDIWNTQEDVFASIANYLSKSKWNANESWGREVKVPAGFDRTQAGREITKPVTAWKQMGVTDVTGTPLPDSQMESSIVFPDDCDRAFVVYGNYKTIMKWNRSLYFATSVGMLADAIGR